MCLFVCEREKRVNEEGMQAERRVEEKGRRRQTERVLKMVSH